MTELAAKPPAKAAGNEKAKKELDRSLRGLFKDLATRPGAVAKDFVQVVGPRNMSREIAAGAADKHEWIQEGYRHKKIELTVTTGDRDNEGPPDRAVVLADLAGYVALFDRQQKVVRELADTLLKLGELELVQKTTRGRGILVASRYLRDVSRTAGEWKETASSLRGRIESEPDDPDPDSEDRIAYARYWREALDVARIGSRKIYDAQIDSQKNLEFEAMKAIVTDPDNKDYKTYQDGAKTGMTVVTNALGGMDATADVLSNVPEGHAKGAAVGIAAAVSVLTVLQVGFGRIVSTAAINHDVKDYKEKNAVGAEYGALDKDPFLIAEMLRRKRVADVELVLKLIGDPVVRELKPFITPSIVLSTLWTTAKELIVQTVDKYEAKRIRIAKAKRAVAKGEKWGDLSLAQAAERLADMVAEDAEVGLDKLKEDITENVFSALNPVELFAGAAIHSLAHRVATIVVEAIPADAAQDVDGSKLFGYADMVAGVLKRGLALKVVSPKDKASVCPEMTDEKVRVATVLSAQQQGELNGWPCWLVRLVDDRIGHLYAMDGTFVELPESDPFREQKLPTHDHLGRSFSEIWQLDTKRAGDGLFSAKVRTAYRARIGYVIGTLEERSKLPSLEVDYYFTPEKVDPSGFVSWSNRFVFDGTHDPEPAGYYDRGLGMRVNGTWHQPWAGRQLYLFIDEDGNKSWASGADKAGNRPNSTIGQVLEHIRFSSDFDFDSTLS